LSTGYFFYTLNGWIDLIGGYMLEKDLNYLAAACGGLAAGQILSVIGMLQEKMTVPFISRYRKEKTDNLDEVGVQKIKDEFEYLSELNARKETVQKTIEQLGKLTAELKSKIENTYSKTELEDIYLPYKPKKRTRATIAREKGLAPLAEKIMQGDGAFLLNELAQPFLNEEKGVISIDDALNGAADILAEHFSEQAEFRQAVRRHVLEKGVMVVSVTDDWQDKRSKFEQYYHYHEPIKTIPAHRILAVRRGEAENVLKLKIEVDLAELQHCHAALLFLPDHGYAEFLEKTLSEALKRLIMPSIQSEIFLSQKKAADEDAIKVFAANLEKLLLAPPAGRMAVMGVDPGYRTGCKIAVLDDTGKLIEHTAIFPTKPQERIEEAKKTVLAFIEKYAVKAIAIGNGTASRETFDFFKQIVAKDSIVMVVSEAGASVYSASEAAREEFPDYDLTVRGAVSIGRRFMDPLSELVKIDPKSIGVGQYQHDVNQVLLKKKLDFVVTSVVNRVGVELNVASFHILKYVSGIGDTLAKNIVEHRNLHGAFSDRRQLLAVKNYGPKAFEQSAGFLRIAQGKNPLDRTGIHPESYFIVENMCQALNIPVEKIIANSSVIDQIEAKKFTTPEFGLFTLEDILKELKFPGRDPRSEFSLFEFTAGVESIADVHEGMVLAGVVTNVVQFGAFVDIGVHQEGLIHVSELSHHFIKNPEDVVAVGDKVRVKVIKVDEAIKRIQLSIKALQPIPAKKTAPIKKQFLKPPPPKVNPNSVESLLSKWNKK
jgi:uncharacterized protein